MTVQTFIEKAIKGGWHKGHYDFIRFSTWRHDVGAIFLNLKTTPPTEEPMSVASILLDPEAWKAVGKVEGWSDSVVLRKHTGFDEKNKSVIEEDSVPIWLFNMHRMIDSLVEGKTIEQYLETL